MGSSNFNKRTKLEVHWQEALQQITSRVYEFRPYYAEELYEILSSRLKEVYDGKVAEEGALRALANYVANKSGGNVREMFQLFLDALELCQRKGMEVVIPQIVDEVKERKF